MSQPVGQISRLLGEEESVITLKKQTGVTFNHFFVKFQIKKKKTLLE